MLQNLREAKFESAGEDVINFNKKSGLQIIKFV